MAKQPKKKSAKTPKSAGKPKKVILQILPRLESGGVERGTVDITKGLVKKGFTVIVVSEGGRLAYQVDAAGGKHITMPVASKNPFRMWLNIFKIRKLIRKYDVDLVHARSRAPAWSAYFACKNTKAKFMTTFHGTYSLKGLGKKWYNSIMTKGERVIAISEFIKTHMVEHYGLQEDEITVIHRGVDLSQFKPDAVNHRRVMQMLEKLKIPEDKQMILLPGRFARWKGHEILLRALEHIPKEEFFCLMVGDYGRNLSYRKELERLVRHLGLEGSVRFVGHMVDMPALYAVSNIVVSASTSQPEAFGRISIEGQAMGKLVVATNHGGSCETIIDGKTGWLVEPGDVEGLSSAILNALHLSSRVRKRIANKAIAHVTAEFSMEQMIDKTIDVYKGLIE